MIHKALSDLIQVLIAINSGVIKDYSTITLSSIFNYTASAKCDFE